MHENIEDGWLHIAAKMNFGSLRANISLTALSKSRLFFYCQQ
jgi:hypothetical protein